MNVAAAAAGTVAVALVNESMSTTGTVITLLVFLLLAGIMNQQEVLMNMARSAGPWRIPRHVQGVWAYVSEDEQEVAVTEMFKFRQIGRQVWGRAESRSVAGPTDYPDFKSRLRGTINGEGIIQGTYRSTKPGRNYYGLFQLVLSRDGKNAEGCWIGVSRHHFVRSGLWTWRGL